MFTYAKYGSGAPGGGGGPIGRGACATIVFAGAGAGARALVGGTPGSMNRALTKGGYKELAKLVPLRT